MHSAQMVFYSLSLSLSLSFFRIASFALTISRGRTKKSVTSDDGEDCPLRGGDFSFIDRQIRSGGKRGGKATW